MLETETIFEFSYRRLDGRTLRLGYRISGGPDVDFEEVIELPEAVEAPNPADPAVAAMLDLVHLTFGVSYYKIACSRQVVAPPVAEPVGAFLDMLYSEGLGEFYFRNNIDPTNRVRFERGGAHRRASCRHQGTKALVLVGGGKDSIVARELARHAAVECEALSLGTARWIESSVAAMGTKHHVVRRTLDPKLFALNERGAPNGHVPISACIAAISQLVAVAGGYSAVLAANERSADEGNTVWNGLHVNHQWSKSFRFESAFRAVASFLVENAPLYVSVLRPMSELAIARMFVSHSQYHEAVSSCNKNFRIREPRAEARWCGTCPKCVFVYLMVAAHAEPEVLAHIFGADFLSDPANLSILADLSGVGAMKPFECVGTPSECRAALGRLRATQRLPTQLDVWYDQELKLTSAEANACWSESMALSSKYALPGDWQRRLDAYLGVG